MVSFIPDKFKDLPAHDQSAALGRMDAAVGTEAGREWLRATLAAVRKTRGKDGRGRNRITDLIDDVRTALRSHCGDDVSAVEINDSTFSRFLEGTTRRPSRLPLGHLCFFILVVAEQTILSPAATKIVRASLKDKPLWGQLSTQILSDSVSAERVHPASPELGIFDALLRHSSATSRLPHHHFLRSPTPWPRADETYYVVYRHSTDNGAIVKSFLVVQTPQKAATMNWGFNHFVQGGPDFHPEVSRISEGVVLSFASSYALLGYSYDVDALAFKTLNPADRAPYRSDVRGIELIAIEETDVKNAKQLFGAVTQTQAASGQPVIARVALLYVGSSSTLRRPISHLSVNPTELSDATLETDIEETIANLRKSGRLPGSLLDIKRTDGRAFKRQVASLAARILAMIDNIPAWEVSPRNRTPSTKPSGRGAIETYSRQGRPRP